MFSKGLLDSGFAVELQEYRVCVCVGRESSHMNILTRDVSENEGPP